MHPASNSISRTLRHAATALAALLCCASLAHADALSAAEKARLAKLDAGPKTIDVAKYPAEQKTAYGVFQKKCVKCHAISRPINSTFVLPDEWQRYIKRMMYKPDSKLSEDDAKVIYRFLTYDSSVRKADSLRVHLARLPQADRDAQLAKVKGLNPAFEAK